MCGRYSIISKKKEPRGSVRAYRLLRQAEVDNRFNAASSQSLPVITTEANELMRSIHARMPVLLYPEEEELWLSSEKAEEHILSLLHPYPSEEMKAYPVSRLVNSPANDSLGILRDSINICSNLKSTYNEGEQR